MTREKDIYYDEFEYIVRDLEQSNKQLNYNSLRKTARKIQERFIERESNLMPLENNA